MKTGKVSNIMITLLLLAVLSILPLSKAYMCPAPEDVYPCRCILSQITTLLCKGRDITIPEIERAQEAMTKVVSAYVLRIKNVHLGKMETSLFEFPIHEAYIEDCSLDGIISTSGGNGQKVSKFTLANLEIHNSIHGNIVIDLSSSLYMYHLSLSNNVMKHLEIVWPSGGTRINALQLVNSSIESVDEDSLESLSTLTFLDMSRNRLQALRKEMRPLKADMLSRLDVSHNQISTISKYYFLNMDNLRFVSFSYNKIQVLNEKVWKFCWPVLDYISLDENPLSCGSEIKWIKGKQPKTVVGTCYTPEDQKSKTLSQVIKENNPTQKYLPKFL